MRHFKVDYQWKAFYSSHAFDNACKEYDYSSIIPGAIKDIGINAIYTGTLQRSIETANVLKVNGNITSTDLLNEVPIKSFANCSFSLPTFLWMAIGRIQWYFECHHQPETKNKTKERIIQLIEIIEREKQDCLLIGHGFYFSQMEKILKKRNYIGKKISYLKNGQIAEYVNNNL